MKKVNYISNFNQLLNNAGQKKHVTYYKDVTRNELKDLLNKASEHDDGLVIYIPSGLKNGATHVVDDHEYYTVDTFWSEWKEKLPEVGNYALYLKK